MTFIPSPEQQAIFDAVEQTTANLAIEALAGTGKTTTLVEVAKLLPRGKSTLFCAFNKDIVGELSRRLSGTGVQAMTFHSIGFRALKKHLGMNDLRPDGGKYRQIAQTWASENPSLPGVIDAAVAHIEDPEQRVATRKELAKDTVKLAIDALNFVRYKLIDWRDPQAVADLIRMYGMDDDVFNDDGIVDTVAFGVGPMMATAEAQVKDGVIDFTDMIYWVVKWNAKLYQFNYVLVDECQDLSPMQRRLIEKALWHDGRIILVGDRFQAIYGFSGADFDSFDLSVETFDATVFPLTVTRRCAKWITHNAAEIVPAFRCPEDKPDGKIVWLPDDEMVSAAQPGDMILCRVKAPLVRAIMQFIAARKPAIILGGEMGKGLITLIEKLTNRAGYTGYDSLPNMLAQYEDEQVERYTKKGDEAMVEATRDQCESLRVCIENARARDLDGLKGFINQLFAENGVGKVVLSTVHKSKGLEADRVFILSPDKLPLVRIGMSADAVQQEFNLDYVARSRAKSVVVYLTNDRFLKQRDNIRPPFVVTRLEDAAPPYSPVALSPAALPAPSDMGEPSDRDDVNGFEAFAPPICAPSVEMRVLEAPHVEPDGMSEYMRENQLGAVIGAEPFSTGDWLMIAKPPTLVKLPAPLPPSVALDLPAMTDSTLALLRELASWRIGGSLIKAHTEMVTFQVRAREILEMLEHA